MQAVPSFLDLAGRGLPLRQSSGEVIGVERILAGARLLLAFSALLAIHFNPARSTVVTLVVLLLYFGHSLALVVIVCARTEISNQLIVLGHTGDLLWPGMICALTNGANSVFFFYFSFALLAAAFRWGMHATLATTVSAMAIMGLEANLSTGPLKGSVESDVNLGGFILRETYLAVFGILIGYLAEAERRRSAQALSMAQISSKARLEAGLKGTMQATLREMLTLFDARGLLLATVESETQQGYLWCAEVSGEKGEVVFSARPLDAQGEQRYLFTLPLGCAGAAWRDDSAASTVAIDGGGGRLRDTKCLLSSDLAAQHPCELLIMCSVSAAPGVQARLFLFEPRLGGFAETQLRILHDLMKSVTPAVYNVYLLRRLRSRATAAERSRVARELHDGVVQSLHAIAFRLYALRTAREINAAERDQEVTDIQQLVQNETTNLRALIRQLEPLDFDPRQLPDFLSRMIQQYRSDTGIEAKFVCDLPEVALPARTCRELAGIVREALANVLKHSGAQNVLVRLGTQSGACVLTIEDDGRGFEFSGRMSYGELKNFRRGPVVIKDRVRAIGGELAIESKPGQGARLEVTFARQPESHLA